KKKGMHTDIPIPALAFLRAWSTTTGAGQPLAVFFKLPPATVISARPLDRALALGWGGVVVGRGRTGEDFRSQQLQELTARGGNTLPPPLAHAGRPDVADLGDFVGPAKRIDDVGIFHGEPLL